MLESFSRDFSRIARDLNKNCRTYPCVVCTLCRLPLVAILLCSRDLAVAPARNNGQVINMT